MALIVDDQSNFKHFCKICKKGFLCGRALGGHMRAHGIGGDESEAAIDDDDDDDDPASDWEDKSNSSSRGSIIPQSSNKRMYALRTNPNNRVRSSRVCENCGKEFISWKSFLEHGNGKCCNSDDTEESGLLSGGSDNDGHGRRGCGWSKRKRSFRMTTTTTTTTTTTKLISEEEDLANCLMMLSNASESYASEAEHRPTPPQPQPQPILPANLDHHYKAKAVSSGISSVNPKGLFECKACKKVFNSHQALGGHRASHKKVKGCFAARLDIGDPDQDNNSLADNNIPPENLLSGGDQEFMKPSKSTLQLDQQGEVGGSKKKSKVHQCSICHRVFSSGQALGGHKRCHWITSNNAPDPLTLARFQQLQDQIEQVQDQFAHNSSDPTILELNNIPLTKKANNNNVTGNIRTDPRNRLSFEVSTDIFLQSNWGTTGNIIENDNYETQENKTIYQSNYNATNNIEDEAESKVKLAKLCEIKDHMSISGNSSPWLQVGIGSSTTLGVDP